MNITTKFQTNPTSGRSQIVAKGNGKQRTVSYDHGHSSDWNHGTAAGTLILALSENDSWILGDAEQSIDEGNAVHDSNDAGTVHRFSL